MEQRHPGFDDLTTSHANFYSNWFQGSVPLTIGQSQAKANAAYESATVLTFKANFNDDHAAQTGNYTGGGLGSAPNEGAGWTGADTVDGTLTSTITTLRADNVLYKKLTLHLLQQVLYNSLL